MTGPKGCGKSTTLAALVDTVNRTRRDHNILTIEDPIEYVHNSKISYVTQREVENTGDTLSFRNALKYALRQDPDVILIGEIRDCETIGIAITSAIRNNIRSGKVDAIHQTLQTSAAERMQTMDQSLIKLCRVGKIDYEAAKPYIYEKSTYETIKALRR